LFVLLIRLFLVLADFATLLRPTRQENGQA